MLNGSDGTSIVTQKALYEAYAKNVTIYYDEEDDNGINLGKWPFVLPIFLEDPFDPEKLDEDIYFTEEPESVDSKLIKKANIVFLVWDGEDEGILSYLAEAIENNKIVVFFNEKTRKMSAIESMEEAFVALIAKPDPTRF